MKKILSLLILVCIGLTSSFGQKKDKKLVQETFDGYKNAILEEKGETAATFVDSKTIQYYSDILEKTKSADSTTVSDMGIIDRLMVFSIRYRTPKAQILSFDGKKLLIYAIQEGMIEKNSIQNLTIGKIDIDKKVATGQLISNGQNVPFHFDFYKEKDIWKIDLTSVFGVSQMAFKQMIKSSGIEENVYLLKLLSMISGKEPKNNIWKPIL